MMPIDDYLITTVTSELFSYITNEWFSENRAGRLRAIFRQRPQSRAVTGRKNHCAHKRILFARTVNRQHSRPRLEAGIARGFNVETAGNARL